MPEVRVIHCISGFRNSIAPRLHILWRREERRTDTSGISVQSPQEIGGPYHCTFQQVVIIQLYALDPNGTSKLEQVRQEIVHYQRKYLCFLDQHKPDQRPIVDEWHLSEYLEVLGSFTLLNHIKGLC